MLAIAMTLGGCATHEVLEADRHDVKINFSAPNIEPGKYEEGVHRDSQSLAIRIKFRSKSLLSALDAISYRLGLNYSVMSDLSPFHVSVPLGDTPRVPWEKVEQHRFNNDREVFDYICQQVNERDLKGQEIKLAYEWNSDGPVFKLQKLPDTAPVCSSKDKPNCKIANYSFKKFFIRNITAMQAMESLWGALPVDFDVKHDNKGQTGELIFRAHSADKTSSVVIYKPQNAVILRAENVETYDRISQLLDAIDASYRQVLIETIAFEYDDTIERKIGSYLNLTKGEGGNIDPVQFRSIFGEGIGNLADGTDTSLPLITFNETEKKFRLLAKLALYDRDGLVRILAQPRLFLQSGQEASVTMAATKYFLTTGVNVPGSLQSVDTGITLKVTPTVLGNGKVFIATDVEQSEFIPTSETNVAVAKNKNTIKTSLVVNDGEMASIGGILIKRDSKFASGVPGIRKIPGLGLLFGSKTGDTSTTRVEFMIRPTVNMAAKEIDNIQNDIQGLHERLQQVLRPIPNEEIVDLTNRPDSQ